MDEKEELAYEHGSRRAWLLMLGECLRQLGRDSSEEWNRARLVSEREDAILKLRSICTDFADNDWPDNLNLTDILSHLEAYLHDPKK